MFRPRIIPIRRAHFMPLFGPPNFKSYLSGPVTRCEIMFNSPEYIWLSCYTNNKPYKNGLLQYVCKEAYTKFIENCDTEIDEHAIFGPKSPVLDFMNDLERALVYKKLLFYGKVSDNFTFFDRICVDDPLRECNPNKDMLSIFDKIKVLPTRNIWMGTLHASDITIHFMSDNNPHESGLAQCILNNIELPNSKVDEQLFTVAQLTDINHNGHNTILAKMNKLESIYRFKCGYKNWTYFTHITIN